MIYSHLTSFIILVYTSGYLLAQAPKMNGGIYKALNNYIRYTNEVVHAANLMQPEFEQLNLVFNRYLENSTPKQPATITTYKLKPILTEYDYFPALPQDLYQQIFDDNVYLPHLKRGQPLQLVGKINALINELDLTRSKLAAYINQGTYSRDSLCESGYKMLKRVEVLYFDLFTLQEKIHWAITEIAVGYEPSPFNPQYLQLFGKLQPLLRQSRELLKTVRAQDFTKSLLAQNRDFDKICTDLETNKLAYLGNIPRLDSSSFCPHKRYSSLLTKARMLLANSNHFAKAQPLRYQNLSHPPHYYYHNQDFLSNYNRYGDGLVAIFNKLIDFSNEYWIQEVEFPMIFELVYPNLPAFAEQNLPKNTLDPEKLAEIWKNRQDSLRRDSLTKTQLAPKPMEGFATNNLIFLLDISSSMNEPEKLPLLKTALTELLPKLRPEDNISIITYSQKANLVLPATSAQNQNEILQVISQLQPESISDANQGLKLAYETAQKYYISQGNNRILLATDGRFELERKTRKLISKGASQQIALSILYFSNKEYATIKTQLEEISTLGKGSYRYIQPENVHKVLLQEAQALPK